MRKRRIVRDGIVRTANTFVDNDFLMRGGEIAEDEIHRGKFRFIMEKLLRREFHLATLTARWSSTDVNERRKRIL